MTQRRHKEDCGNLRGAVCECFLTEDAIDTYGDRPMCGHKYCPANRCGYMPEPLKFLPSPSRVTVFGNGITVYRLDEQGNPVGEGLSLDTAVSLSIDADADDDTVIEGWDTAQNTFTMDLDLCDVDPDLLALFTGQAPLRPFEVWGSPRLYRWLPRFIRRRLKARWIRRGYGG